MTLIAKQEDKFQEELKELLMENLEEKKILINDSETVEATKTQLVASESELAEMGKTPVATRKSQFVEAVKTPVVQRDSELAEIKTPIAKLKGKFTDTKEDEELFLSNSKNSFKGSKLKPG